MSIGDLESLEATLQILSDPRLVDEIREAETEIAKGEGKRLTKEQALELRKHK